MRRKTSVLEVLDFVGICLLYDEQPKIRALRTLCPSVGHNLKGCTHSWLRLVGLAKRSSRIVMEVRASEDVNVRGWSMCRARFVCSRAATSAAAPRYQKGVSAAAKQAPSRFKRRANSSSISMHPQKHCLLSNACAHLRFSLSALSASMHVYRLDRLEHIVRGSSWSQSVVL